MIAKKYISFIWLILLIELFVLSIFSPLVTDYELLGLVAVIIHVVFAVFLLQMSSSKFSTVFIWAFIVRLVFMLWDLYARHIYILPNSEGDSYLYFEGARVISQDLSNLLMPIRGGLYSKITGIIFYFTGPMRVLGQYFNVLLGLMVLIFVQRILVLLKVKEKTIKIILLIAAFFPNSIIMSAIFLREILPTFLVVLSLFYLVKWYLSNNLLQFIWSLVFLALGAMFHSGVIGLALGYLIMLLFYDRTTKRFNFTLQNFFLFIPVVIFVFLFTTQFGDAMFSKFRVIQESEDMYKGLGVAARGGSAYLEGLKVNNPQQVVIYGPIRAIYFLFSPVPWNWRGVQDIVTFFIDSLLYGYVLYYFIRNKKYFLQNKQLIMILMVALLIAVFIYGIGVSNAGTAMRHRQKLIPVFLVMLGIMMHETKRTKMLLKKITFKKHILKNGNK